MHIIEISSEPLTMYEPPYYLKYDKGVKKIFQTKIFKQLLDNWHDTKKWLMVYREFDIDTNPIMEMITKIFFFVYRINKQIIAEKKAELKKQRNKQRKLYTLRNKKMLYKTV